MQPRLPSSFERNRTRLWVGLALAILMVVLSAIASVIHLRHVAEQQTYTTIHNMARSIEQSQGSAPSSSALSDSQAWIAIHRSFFCWILNAAEQRHGERASAG